MEEVAGKKRIHIGRNMKFAREYVKGLTQEDLAVKINMSSSTISRLEQQEVIEDDILDIIALALEMPVSFFKTFDPDALSNVYNNSYNINSADRTQDNIANQGKQENTVNNFPLSEVMEMAEKLLTMQKEHYEKEMQLLGEKHELDKENALLKLRLEIAEGK